MILEDGSVVQGPFDIVPILDEFEKSILIFHIRELREFWPLQDSEELWDTEQMTLLLQLMSRTRKLLRKLLEFLRKMVGNLRPIAGVIGTWERNL